MTADSDGVYLGFNEGKFASHGEGHFDTVVIQKILDVFCLVVTPRNSYILDGWPDFVH